jgi:hypothetical protein
METVITGHEAEMAALAEIEGERPAKTVAQMIRRLSLMVDGMPPYDGNPPAYSIFGEPYGEEGMRRDLKLDMERLASMAAKFAEMLAD